MSGPIEIASNQDLAPLEQWLAGIKRAGDYFVTGVLEMSLPRVEV